MEKRLTGVEGLARYLDLSPETIRSWVKLRKVPFYKVGRLVKFDLSEIDVILKKNHVEAHPVY